MVSSDDEDNVLVKNASLGTTIMRKIDGCQLKKSSKFQLIRVWQYIVKIGMKNSWDSYRYFV